jgi:hypothetical protein
MNESERKSMLLWVEAQRNFIESLKFNVQTNEKDVEFTLKRIAIGKEQIEHEEKVLKDYIEDNSLDIEL